MRNWKGYVFGADLVRVVAIVAVVTVHVSDELVSRTNYFGGVSWWMGNLVNVISRSGVPLFIMLSGYLLLDKNRVTTVSKQLNRAFFRIFVPLVFWVLVYLYWRHFWYYREEFNLSYILELFLSSKVFHLYYLFIILGLYLITPYLKKILIRYSNLQKLRLMIGSFVFGFLAVLMTNLFPSINFIINSFTIFSVYLGYFLVGDYLRDVKVSKSQGIMLLLTVLVLTLVTGALLFFTNNQAQYFKEYLSINIIVISLSLFTLLFNIENYFPGVKNKILFKAVMFISSVAFGIYLIHPIIVDLLDHYGNFAIHLIRTNLWIYIIEKIFLVLVISAAVVFVGIKTPVFNKVFGER